MRRLVLRDVVWRLAILLRDLLGAHRLDDSGEFVSQIRVLLDLVLVEVDRDANERSAEMVAIERVEVEIDVAIRVEAPVHAGSRRHRAQIIVAHGALPTRAPAGRTRRNRGRLNRAPVRLHLPHVSAPDETERTVIEIVAVEFVDAHADRAGGDERIEVELVLVEESYCLGGRLVGEVA